MVTSGGQASADPREKVALLALLPSAMLEASALSQTSARKRR